MGKAPKWKPSKKELEKILEVDNELELFLVGQVCIERIIEKIIEKKFNIHSEVLEDARFLWYQKFLILDKSDLFQGKGSIMKNAALINEIRNKYSHRLKPNEKAIDDKISRLEYLGASHANSITKAEKYRICVISTFSALEEILRS